MGRESKRLKKSSSWLNSGNVRTNTAFEKNAIFAFSHLPGSAETSYLMWYSKVSFDCLLYQQHFCKKNIKIH